MTKPYSLMLLPGDGIGPEVMAEVRKLIAFLETKGGLSFDLQEGLIGGASIDAHGVPLTDETLEKCRQVDAVLLGAVGGPQWDKVPFDIRPEAGLLRIRKEMGLFANLRPAVVFDALLDASTLKPDVVRGLDIMIVRELTGGVYFGEPRGIFDFTDEEGNAQRRGVNTQVYTTAEIRRVGRVAFELARQRQGRVCSCEKANVMESGKLWREEMTRLHAEEFADVALTHMYADNCAMQLLRNPRQFDVIVTDNLFGDILSDEASMLTGSLGMLPSASLGAHNAATGHRSALYEPVHGSAPDIAGKGVANPLAMILSFAMCLRYSFQFYELSLLVEAGVRQLLGEGVRSSDIVSEGGLASETSDITDALIQQMKKRLP